MQQERRNLQQEIKQERELLEKLRREHSQLEGEVRRLTAAKEQQENRLR